jgi:hypothetical protein
MPRGYSGRIVLEIDPSIKDSLYIALARKKLTLKDWFVRECTSFIAETNQPHLFADTAAEQSPGYGETTQ